MDQGSKTLFKLGDMTIDQKQVFWKMKHCYAMIPIVQLLDGRILIHNKSDILLTNKRQV